MTIGTALIVIFGAYKLRGKMTILVTGSTGFLGKNLIPKLVSGHHNLLLSTRHDLDLLDIQSCNQFANRYKFDTIIHLAALAGGIGANRESPYDFIADNLQINLNVMNMAINNRVSKIITIGSVCAYPKFTPIPFREEDIWSGKPEHTNAGYGESKRALMLMCEGAKQQYGLYSIHLIPTNLYGRFDNFNPDSSHVIPALIRKIQFAIDNGLSSVEVWGSGFASRDFLHVSDCADAIVLSLDYDDLPIINLGSGHGIEIRSLVELLCELMGYDGRIVYNDNYPDGQPKRELDISRASTYLGWKPAIDFREGLKDLIGWYRINYE